MWRNYYSLQVKKSSLRIRDHQLGHVYKYFDAVKIKDVTKKQYQDMLIDLLKKELAESTISGIHDLARIVFKKAVELEVIKKDPTEYARPPRKRPTLEDIETIE